MFLSRFTLYFSRIGSYALETHVTVNIPFWHSRHGVFLQLGGWGGANNTSP